MRAWQCYGEQRALPWEGERFCGLVIPAEKTVLLPEVTALPRRRRNECRPWQWTGCVNSASLAAVLSAPCENPACSHRLCQPAEA